MSNVSLGGKSGDIDLVLNTASEKVEHLHEGLKSKTAIPEKELADLRKALEETQKTLGDLKIAPSEIPPASKTLERIHTAISDVLEIIDGDKENKRSDIDVVKRVGTVIVTLLHQIDELFSTEDASRARFQKSVKKAKGSVKGASEGTGASSR